MTNVTRLLGVRTRVNGVVFVLIARGDEAKAEAGDGGQRCVHTVRQQVALVERLCKTNKFEGDVGRGAHGVNMYCSWNSFIQMLEEKRRVHESRIKPKDNEMSTKGANVLGPRPSM